MKAAVFHEFGGPEVLNLEEVPLPEPQAGQVRVQVHAVSVNQTLDIMLRRGESGWKIKLPMALSMGRIAGVQPGETVLINGAAGALSSCLVQVCKHAGAQVIAGAGADARVKAALSLGADHGINYRQQNLKDEVLELTNGK